jgi:hypothetical protein
MFVGSHSVVRHGIVEGIGFGRVLQRACAYTEHVFQPAFTAHQRWSHRVWTDM